MKRLVLMALLLLPAICQALPPVRMSVIYYPGTDSISVLSAFWLTEQVREFYKETFNLRLIRQRFELRELPAGGCQEMSGFTSYSCWRAVTSDTHRIRSRQRLTLAIMPPMFQQGIKLFAGYGDLESYGRQRGLALAHCSDTNSGGTNRVAACFLVMAHEIGHNLGLWHCDEGTPWGCDRPNFMRSAPGAYIDQWGFDLPVAQYSKAQLRNYFSELKRGML